MSFLTPVINSPWRTLEGDGPPHCCCPERAQAVCSMLEAPVPVLLLFSVCTHASQNGPGAPLSVGGRTARSRCPACLGTAGCWQRGPQAMVAILARLLPDTTCSWGEPRRAISDGRTKARTEGEGPAPGPRVTYASCGAQRLISRCLGFLICKISQLMAQAPCVFVCVCVRYCVWLCALYVSMGSCMGVVWMR